MLINPYKYEDYNRHVTLRDGIEGLTPYHVVLPEAPPLEEFVNFGLPPREQFFRREIIPPWVWKLTKEANKKGAANKGARAQVIKTVEKIPEYTNFVADQWHKRQYGLFIFINGRPTWIPPKHWYYLNYYYLDDGLPQYYTVDREYYYWWELCVEQDDRVYGGIEFTKRRDGKSYRGGNTLLFNVTENKSYQAGMQSKTNDDSRDLFMRTVVLPWRRLPFYFSPKYDNKNYPVKEINFRDPESEIDYDENDVLAELTSDELNSSVECRATVHTAFDGNKLKFYYFDESGKTEEMLASQAWRVHKQCLRIGTRIIGKALLTSTVEETTKGGLKEFKKIWTESDHAKDKLTALGQTKSGLIRYFKPAYETMAFDQYGESIIDDPKDYQAEYRKAAGDPHWDKGGRYLVDMEIEAETDPIERQRVIHMYPRTIKEALRANPKDCEFDAIAIDNRLDDFLYGNDEIVRVELEWENGKKDTKVIAYETDTGKWIFKKSVWKWIQANSNNVVHNPKDNLKMPGFAHMGTIGADPYKYNATNQDRRSLGTAMAYMEYNMNVEEATADDTDEVVSNDFIMLYGHRHMDKTRYGEDMIMSCHFLGFPIFPEINVASLWDYFVTRGYEHFLKYRQLMKKKKKGTGVKIEESKTPGATTLGDVIKEPIFSLVGTYIRTRADSCVFEDFLRDCREVEYKDWSPHDYFVAGGYAIYGSKGISKPAVEAAANKNYQAFLKPRTVTAR